MSDSNNEFPHVEFESSVENEDLDECRETDDDEFYSLEHLDSHLEQSNTSHHSQSSYSTIDSKLKSGQKAISYDEGEALTSSSDSNKENSAANCDSEGDYESYAMEDMIDDEGFTSIKVDKSICEKDVKRLMRKLRMKQYTAKLCEEDLMISKCKALIERDYSSVDIDNPGGTLSENYPGRIQIPTAGRSNTSPDLRFVAPDFNIEEYYHKIEESAESRLLSRFVAPVILFDGKFICRSGSLTVRKTAAFESARKKPPPQNLEITSSAVTQIGRSLVGSMADLFTSTFRAGYQLVVPGSMVELRAVDAAILKDLNIQHICDLMVEDRKRFKQISISSSEKVNKDTYKDFAIEEMPYPGCEFFARYNAEKHTTNGLMFDWEKPDVNAKMEFSVDPREIFPDVNWTEYKEWDLLELTQNYLKMMLSFLVRDSGGMLIHCISGWDRTPLFISLLRMSLWADGLIHQTLGHIEMAYFTLAYDWYLFGHDFPNRISQKQEILRFCFDILRSIWNEEFSATRMFHSLTTDQQRGRKFPEHEEGTRRRILEPLREFVLGIYDEELKRITN